MIQLRFYLTDTPIQRNAYENRKEETLTKTTVVNGVKTVTTTTTVSTSKGGHTSTTTNSSTRGTTSASKKSPVKSTAKQSTTITTTSSSEDPDVYSIKRLTSDLRSGLNTLKEDLRAEQSDLHNYEDGRAETLSHLEKVHKELESEHINDQVIGEELRRLDKDVMSEIDISSSQFEDQKDSLRRRIDHNDIQIKETEPIVDTKKAERDQIQNILDKDQQITLSNLSQTTTDLRKDNDEQRKKFQDSKEKVRNEREEKVKVFNQHADLVNSFNELVMRYEKFLSEVEQSRKGVESEKNQVDFELSTENSNGTNLEHYLNSTNRDNKAHLNTVDALRKDLDSLRQHYSKFESQLNGFVGSQNDEMKKLQAQLNNQESEITKLQKNLSESANQIVELHANVDKENAANLNAKLSILIQTLVDVGKYRRTNQNRLENAQEIWSAKLKLFEDEASRMSKENANKKRADEIDNLLHKLDKLNTERNAIAREKDEIEAKLLTDNNSDKVTEKMERELDSLNLKLTWANDEIVKTHGDLQDLIKFLEFKRSFLLDQEEQLTTLRAEIIEVRSRIDE
jgi:chromosome segregation ATPase